MKHLFFLGIAGHAMAGLALAAKNRGYRVTGLDEAGGPPMSVWLDDHSLEWSKTYDPALLNGVDAIVISGQHGSEEHPIIKAARQRNLRVLSFAELLGEITQGVHVVAVAGTHGKTTTTSLITWLLESAGRSPDFLIGVRPFNFEASSRLRGADVAVIEADEYKASTLDVRPKFDYYHPDVLVLTSVEHDHPDVFPTLNSYLAAFEHLVGNMPRSGCLVVCADDSLAMQVATKTQSHIVTYGLHNAEYGAKNITYTPTGITFDVIKAGTSLGFVSVPLFGEHNVLNSLAAVAVALREGIRFDQVQKAAVTFKGTLRRFNIVTKPKSAVTVVDDYAHHPTEAKAVIAAAKKHFPGRRLVAVYRPHTYSRTQVLLREYHQAFNGVDQLYITDVESAREHANQQTVSGREIVNGLPEELRKNTYFASDRTELVKKIISHAQPGDVILCMTVSGYGDLANELALAVG